MCVPVWTGSSEERLKHVVFCGGTQRTGKLSLFPLISSNLLTADAQLKVLQPAVSRCFFGSRVVWLMVKLGYTPGHTVKAHTASSALHWSESAFRNGFFKAF